MPERAGSNLGGDRDPNIYGITVGSVADPNFPPNLPGVGGGDASLAQSDDGDEHFPQGWPLTRRPPLDDPQSNQSRPPRPSLVHHRPLSSGIEPQFSRSSRNSEAG
jgi:hypothetical protein